MNISTTAQPKWIPDDIITSLSALQRKESTTMELDKSQPPTPDGTGQPANFHQIAPGLYRSSYPAYPHFDSLRSLKIKTIITLVTGEIPIEYSNFISSDGITHHQIPILANKNPEVFTDVETIHEVLKLLLKPSNYPLLIHCNKGRHRTGCMVACFRKVTGWSDEAVIEEYIRYSTPKERDLDQTFIRQFDPTCLKSIAYERGYVGGVYKQPIGLSEESTKSSVYTNNTLETYTSTEDEYPSHHYQETIRTVNTDVLESSRR